MIINLFLEYLLHEKNYSQNTITAYKTDLIAFKDFCVTEFDQEDLVTIHYNQIRSWIVFLVNEGIENRTINRKVSSLKTFYKFLQKTEEINVSPLAKHKALKVQKKSQIPFTQKEVNTVISNLEQGVDFVSVRNRLIVELFYSTGIRRMELISIKEKDVDLNSKLVKVLGKRNKERYVPLLPSVIKTIKEYFILKKEIKGQVEELLITKKGLKIYEMLNEGADLNSVKELLGHSSLASTQVYTHNSLDKMKKMFNNAHPRSKKIK